MSKINKLWIKLFYKQVGRDNFGNLYYVNKNSLGKEKRYVYYDGIDEGSKVPPMWHAWLHYLTDDIPVNTEEQKYSWQQGYIPNLSGTKHAYKSKKSDDSNSYNPWTPN
ncbi:MAG TPA: NADH-ubiquinone oxidoreductase subunit NDUFA12 family protein [Candidatus Megaira endosymbiont of Nemacystus decipiens]|nr:NADH-ubiquinone oxidoreductase subunit NDUFA12 family protein [Candidatus Megaera endosymbiont of Nemacystus decipiens]